MPPQSQTLLHISPEDNVLVAMHALEPGTLLEIDGNTVSLEFPIGLGQKIAARGLSPGEKIIKYGVPIGSATTAIKAGEHIPFAQYEKRLSAHLSAWKGRL